uniref:Uncharacterized protein n=1 Tax=Peronospora matthiolae TaxID=2874970 RepID=A0AAV1VL82_9STRA
MERMGGARSTEFWLQASRTCKKAPPTDWIMLQRMHVESVELTLRLLQSVHRAATRIVQYGPVRKVGRLSPYRHPMGQEQLIVSVSISASKVVLAVPTANLETEVQL